MARTRKALPAKVDVAHLISAGVLASVCPRALIEEVLAETGKASQRERLLPAPAVVYYVMALALWREAPLEEVLRVVCEGLHWLGGGEAGAMQASKSAISQARSRLGPEVMKQLADRVLCPLARPGAPGAWYRGWRMMAVDGSCMDVADEAANAKHFGYPGASRGQSAFPQARVLGLVECGTHAVVAASIAPYSHSEVAMAAELLPPKLTRDMLVMADRNFYSFKLWQKACATGAALLWRVKSNLGLSVDEELADGSYLSRVYDSDDKRRRNG
ncbi:MAG: IS4 family transposase, partial [Polaromonas sp.]